MVGKIALITGAAAGIGKAAAVALAQAGMTVIATDVDEATGRKTVDSLPRGAGARHFFTHNVVSEQDWVSVVDSVRDLFGRIDVLVNNAGVSSKRRPIVEMSLEDWRHVMAINLDAPFLGIKHVAPLMIKGGGGSIINVSSIFGKVGGAGVADYCASKGGITQLTKAAAIELAKDGVRVNSIHPGFIDTPMLRAGLEAGAALGFQSVEARRDHLLSLHPLGRLGEPKDIAEGILFLASDASAFMTGAELVMDAGYLAQ